MKGKEWRIAALFEDKWWDGTLVSRTGKNHKEFPLHYVVKYPDGGGPGTPGRGLKGEDGKKKGRGGGDRQGERRASSGPLFSQIPGL